MMDNLNYKISDQTVKQTNFEFLDAMYNFMNYLSDNQVHSAEHTSIITILKTAVQIVTQFFQEKEGPQL